MSKRNARTRCNTSTQGASSYAHSHPFMAYISSSREFEVAGLCGSCALHRQTGVRHRSGGPTNLWGAVNHREYVLLYAMPVHCQVRKLYSMEAATREVHGYGQRSYAAYIVPILPKGKYFEITFAELLS